MLNLSHILLNHPYKDELNSCNNETTTSQEMPWRAARGSRNTKNMSKTMNYIIHGLKMDDGVDPTNERISSMTIHPSKKWTFG